MLEQFVPTADDPTFYRLVKDPERQQTLEYQLATRFMSQTHWKPWSEPCQGMYIVTPSGKLLAGGNRPHNVESTLDDMRKGLEAYAKLPREERLLPQVPDAQTDRVFPEGRPKPPADGLVLRVAGRGFEENLGNDCPQLPKYYSVDRLWYTRDEAVQFLPDRLEPGEQKEITGPAFTGMARLYLIARGSHWEVEDINELKLRAEVVEVNGTTAHLRLTGRADFDANRQFNTSKYRPELLGYLSYDTAQKRFTRFDLIAYGMHNISGNDRKPGGPEYFPMGIWFSLNGSNVNDQHEPYKLNLYRWVKLKSVP